jgi:hypothetical protein
MLVRLGTFDRETELAKLHAQGIDNFKTTAFMLATPSSDDKDRVQIARDIQQLVCASLSSRCRHFIQHNDFCRMHHVPSSITSVILKRLQDLFVRDIDKSLKFLLEFLTEASDIDPFSHICFWVLTNNDREMHFLLLDGEQALTSWPNNILPNPFTIILDHLPVVHTWS